MHESNSIGEIIKSISAEISESHNIPSNFIVCYENKNENEKTNESVWLCEPVTGKKSKMVFNYALKGRKNAYYFSFAIKKKMVSEIKIPHGAEIKELASDALNIYINFSSWSDEIPVFMKELIKYYVTNFEPADKFGCCGKYTECSKEGKCIHNNKFYAKACWYRKNLEAGKIFY